jgi:hypothetical protein
VLTPTLPPLSEWESFYVIIGSSAAALTGLMFVVVTLSAETGRVGERAMRAFASPTVVHFCAVLLIAAVLSTPGHTVASLSLCLGAIALAGLAYTGWVALQALRQQDYKPVLSDWVWHTILPPIAYATLLAAAVLARRHPAAALYLVAAIALLLLFVGLHNAWDSVVWTALARAQSTRGAEGESNNSDAAA